MAYWYEDQLDKPGVSSGSGSWYDQYLDQPKTVEAPKAKPKEEIGPFRAGLIGSTADIMTAGARTATALGFPETGEDWLKGAETRRQKVEEQYHPKVPSYEDIYKPDDILGTLGRAGQYGYEKIAESAPQMAALAAAGVAGAAAAPAALPTAAAGLGAAAFADVPFFTGSNIKAQMETGKKLKDTSLGTAFAASIPQSLLDVALGEVLPGVGRAVAGRALVRAAKKGIEGVAIEGVSEGLQQAIEIGQADPLKLYKMDPATQKEIIEAAVAGGFLGGTVGGVSGAAQRAKAPKSPLDLPQSSPMGVEPVSPGVGLPEGPEDGAPPPAEPTSYPNRTGLPGPYEPDPSVLFPPGTEERQPDYQPDRTGLPGPAEPWQPNPDVMFPSGPGQSAVQPVDREALRSRMMADQALSPSPGTMPQTRMPGGMPVTSLRPRSTQAEPDLTQMAFGTTPAVSPVEATVQEAQQAVPELAKVVPTMQAKSTGQKVYKDIQQQLLAAGQKPLLANANAKIVRAFYEKLATRVGTDAYSLYSDRKIKVQAGDEAVASPTTYNQPETDKFASTYSHLQKELTQASNKSMTGQQWLNHLKKRGVKDEELHWTDLRDQLGETEATKPNLNAKFTGAELLKNMFGYSVGKIAHEPVKAGKPGYSAVTLGNYGEDPAANYRETMLTEDAEGPQRRGQDRFESSHWPGVPNPIAHYRTTDRSLANGANSLHLEELQSDWHQQGRKRGYRDDSQLQRMREIEKIWNNLSKDEQETHAEEYYRLRDQYTNGVPRAPFSETWPTLAFKHALLDAINQGKDYLTWTTGKDMAHVQGHDDERRIAAHKKFMDERIVNIANKLGKPYGAQVEVQRTEDTAAREQLRSKENLLADMQGEAESLRDALDMAETPSYRKELKHELAMKEMGVAALSREIQNFKVPSHTLHALKITPQMREIIGDGGLPLFQKNRGQISFDDNTVIRLFKTSDASTFMHEAAHLFLNEMRKYALQSKEVAADLQEILDWLGAKDSASINRQQHEKFARGFELYLREGKAPSKSLADVFKRFAEWLGMVYGRASALNVKVPQNIHKVYDRMLAQTKSLRESSPVEDEFDPGPMPKPDPETFSQSGRDDVPRTVERQRARIAEQQGVIKSTEQTLASMRALHQSNVALLQQNPTASRRDRVQKSAQSVQFWQERLSQRKSDLRQYMDDLKAHHETAETFNQDPIREPNSVARVAKRAWRFTKNLADPLSDVPNQAAYLDARNLTSGLIYRGAEAGKNAQKLYAKLTPGEQETVTQFFESSTASPSILPDKVRTQTVALKHRIYELGQGLVQAGALKPETFEKRAGEYIPRLYLKHLLEHNGLTGAGLKANLSEIKQRKNLPLETRLALGEIRHPGVLTNVALMRMERDIAALRFLDQVAGNANWSLGKSMTTWEGHRVTPEWLLSEAEDIDKKRAEAMEKMDPERAAAMRDIADKMRQAAYSAKAELETIKEGEAFDPKDWKQLPNKPQFGSLRGAWVRSQIADDITGMADFVNEHSWAGRMLGDKNSAVVRATQFWKMLKVPFSPAAQMRNFVSNIIAANVFGEIPLHKTIPYIIRAAKEMRRDGPVWKVAKEYGIPQGTMAENELHTLADAVTKGLENANYSGPMGMVRAWTAINKAGAFVTDTYGKSEALFKTAVMAHAMDKGMAPNDAVRLANEAIFDYSLTHPSVKYLRNAPLGMPFLTYTYKMLPKLAQTVASRRGAMRMLPYVAMMYALPAMVAGMYDLEDGDIDKLRMAMSDALRRQENMYLMPYKDDSGRWQFVDIGYFFPWQMPQDIGAGILKGKPDEAIKPLASLAFSSPIISAITALKTGIDPFTNRPIADKRDPLNKQVTDIMAYVWSLAMPSVLANYGAVGKAMEKIDGTGINRYGEPTPDWTQIGARMFGVNIYPVIPEAQRARNLQHMQSEIQQVKSRMTYALKDQSLTPEQRQRLAVDYRDKLMEMSKELVKYSRDSAMTPSLRAAASRP